MEAHIDPCSAWSSGVMWPLPFLDPPPKSHDHMTSLEKWKLPTSITWGGRLEFQWWNYSVGGAAVVVAAAVIVEGAAGSGPCCSGPQIPLGVLWRSKPDGEPHVRTWSPKGKAWTLEGKWGYGRWRGKGYKCPSSEGIRQLSKKSDFW